jgi:heme/copper-type cytochrome/quinol oxidase subunit 2
MKKLNNFWEVFAVASLVIIVIGLPIMIYGYHVKNFDNHFAGKVVRVVARNDELINKPGLWMVQKSPYWNYADKNVPNDVEVCHHDTVTMLFTSVDTTHEFSLEDYEVKKKVIAGKVSEVEFVADMVGQFEYECINYCGTGHEEMKGTLLVRSDQECPVPHDHPNL